MINHITSKLYLKKWFPNQTNIKPISSTVCRVVASKLRGLLLLQWSSTLNLIHANLFVHATAQPLPASQAAKRPPAASAPAATARRRRCLYLQLTVARPAQMLMLVSAQEQLSSCPSPHSVHSLHYSQLQLLSLSRKWRRCAGLGGGGCGGGGLA